jgi:hypothetical protein
MGGVRMKKAVQKVLKAEVEGALKKISDILRRREKRERSTVNIWNIYRDVQRLLQPMQDKRKNLSTLNRDNYFPLKREEIDEFLSFIYKSTDALNSYFYNLYLFKEDPEELFYDANIKFHRAHTKKTIGRKLTDGEKKDFESLMMSIYMIYKECPDFRVINGLKTRIENIKSQIIESTKYEELRISESRYQKDALIKDTAVCKKAVNGLEEVAA